MAGEIIYKSGKFLREKINKFMNKETHLKND
jgi:hypothetical protein